MKNKFFTKLSTESPSFAFKGNVVQDSYSTQTRKVFYDSLL